MRYLPHTEEDIRTMFNAIGVRDFEDLFRTVPASCRYDGKMNIPAPKTEWSLNEYMAEIRSMMEVKAEHAVLVGAGRYYHHIPSTVPSLMSRSEFLTAYTPYQPEMAQGTLQGLFEYQTLTARLLGVDVANASMYDGASALAEALLMGVRVAKKKRKVAVSTAIHPHFREVVAAYFRPTEYDIVELPFLDDGRTDLSVLAGEEDLAAVALQSPNFFGVIEDMEHAAQVIHDAGALSVAAFSEPLAFGLIKSPGECGPISSAAKGRASESPFLSEARGWECSAAEIRSSAICPAAWSARPPILTARGGSCSPFQPGSSIYEGRRRRQISAPTRGSAPLRRPCTWPLSAAPDSEKWPGSTTTSRNI